MFIMYSIKILPLFLLGFLFIQGCATSGLNVKQPHIYTNSYFETVQAVDKALKQNNMAVLESDEQPNSYYVKVYSVTANDEDVLSSNPAFRNDMLHSASIWIKAVDDFSTEVRVVEDEQSGLASSEQRQHLARNFYKKLNRILTLSKAE